MKNINEILTREDLCYLSRKGFTKIQMSIYFGVSLSSIRRKFKELEIDINKEREEYLKSIPKKSEGTINTMLSSLSKRTTKIYR